MPFPKMLHTPGQRPEDIGRGQNSLAGAKAFRQVPEKNPESFRGGLPRAMILDPSKKNNGGVTFPLYKFCCRNP
jgi:hypothetical protein